jgi:hypothetical protein
MSLAEKNIGDDGARLVAAVLHYFRYQELCFLSLQNNSLTAVAVSAIAPAIRDHPGIKYFDMTGNPIGEEGAIALAAALPPRMETLDLKNTALGDAGMTALIEALPRCPLLSELTLSKNAALTAAAFQALGAAMAAGGAVPNLTELVLWDCERMGCTGAQGLAVGLPKAPKLRVLDLCNCGIGNVGARAIAAVLPQCALRQLDMTQNEFDGAVHDELTAVKGRCPDVDGGVLLRGLRGLASAGGMCHHVMSTLSTCPSVNQKLSNSNTHMLAASQVQHAAENASRPS